MTRVGLVTGAARGIGLELCRLLLEKGDTVVACPRSGGSDELGALAGDFPDTLHVVAMDVRSDASVAAAVAEIEKRVDRIDVLFNNAGIYPKDTGLEALDLDDLTRAFEVNGVGPLRVVRACLPLLRRGHGRRLIQITSLMGSIADNSSGGSYAYRMSKTALNMAVKNLGHELGREGFISLAIHPGWVQTRMGGPAAPMDVRACATETVRIALSAEPADNGSFRIPGGHTQLY